MSENNTDGASYSEQILESARRNNTELLLQIKVELNNDNVKLSQLINSTSEVITMNSPLHIGCQLGNWEWLDIVLDIEGVEIDHKNRRGQTPLHLAVMYANNEPEHGTFIVDNLLDAGANPTITDSDNLKPINYISTPNEKLSQLLESAEYAISMEIPAQTQLDMLDDKDDTPSDSDDDV
jgi:ankyrin repeat protein